MLPHISFIHDNPVNSENALFKRVMKQETIQKFG